MRTTCFAHLALAAVLLACRSEGRGPSGDAAPPLQEAAPLQQPQADGERPVALLIDSLRSLTGQFELLPENRWSFVGSSGVFGEFVPFGDSAVVRLVDCLDGPGEGVATVGGRRVPIGVLCAWALRHVASFESGAEDEVNGTWPGAVEPTATRAQLEAAALAWRQVVAAHRYRLN